MLYGRPKNPKYPRSYKNKGFKRRRTSTFYDNANGNGGRYKTYKRRNMSKRYGINTGDFPCTLNHHYLQPVTSNSTMLMSVQKPWP